MMKPILFNTEMVRAILDGRKTVTRRIIKPQPKMRLSYVSAGSHNVGKWEYPSPNTYKYWGDEWRLVDSITEEDLERAWTPPCHTDDILYVRETWCKHGNPKAGRPMHYDYKADRTDPQFDDSGFIAEWRPSIHMPKEAARLFLKVTNVTVERLQNMTMQDSLREGVKLSLEGLVRDNKQEITAVHNDSFIELQGISADGKWGAMRPFADIWDSTISKNDISVYGWDANPFVWVIEFERISREEAKA